jgi:hypothetical protein
MAGYCLMRSPGGDRDGIDTVVHVGLGGQQMRGGAPQPIRINGRSLTRSFVPACLAINHSVLWI